MFQIEGRKAKTSQKIFFQMISFVSHIRSVRVLTVTMRRPTLWMIIGEALNVMKEPSLTVRMWIRFGRIIMIRTTLGASPFHEQQSLIQFDSLLNP